MEVRRTCPFAAIVLTPAAARNGAKASRFDADTIHFRQENKQENSMAGNAFLSKGRFDHVREVMGRLIDVGLIFAFDHYSSQVFRP